MCPHLGGPPELPPKPWRASTLRGESQPELARARGVSLSLLRRRSHQDQLFVVGTNPPSPPSAVLPPPGGEILK